MSKYNVLDILKDNGVNLEQKGHEFWCSCPFHEDASPSFSADDEKWFCFSCKSGGGPVDLIAKFNGISKIEAQRIYNLKVGRDDIPANIKMLNNMVEYFNSFESDYLVGRGITREVQDLYQIGYCPSFDNFIKEFNINPEDLRKLGMDETIENCIVYPFFDERGCFKVHWRTIEDKQYRFRKSEFWKKQLWGLHKINSKKTYIFEGFHDVMVARQHGIPAVATCGTYWDDKYWDDLYFSGVDHVVLVFDGDYGGMTFLKKMVENIDKRFIISCKILGSGDPDEHIMDGTFNDLPILNILEWYTQDNFGKIDSLTDKMIFIRDIKDKYLKMSKHDQHLFRQTIKDFDEELFDFLETDIHPDFKLEKIVLSNAAVSNSAKDYMFLNLEYDDFKGSQNRKIFDFIKSSDVSLKSIEHYFGLDMSEYVDLIKYKDYIDKLKDISTRIKVIKEVDRYRTSLFNNDVASVTQQFVTGVFNSIDKTEYVHDTEDVIKRTMSDINEKVQNPGVTGIPLSKERFPIFNKSLMGFVKDKFILLSGYTGHGKTILAENLIDDLIFDKHEQVAFVSLEMHPDELMQRQISINTGISGFKIATGSLEQSEYDEVLKFAKNEALNNMHIVHGTNDFYSVITILKSMIKNGNAKVIFMDYLQLFMMNSRKERWEQLLDMSRIIKTEICSMGVTVVAISQLTDAGTIAGSKGMLRDVDVGINIKSLRGDECKDGVNFMINIAKHRYSDDDINIPCFFNRQTLTIREVM